MENKSVTFASKLTDWEEAKWQLIFKTETGLDYCRETFPVSSFPTNEDIAEHAGFLLTTNNDVSSVVIEKW